MAITQETLLIAADARRRLLDLTNAQVVDLTRAWVDAWSTLQPELEDAYEEMLLAQAKDGRVPARLVAKNRRLAAAIQQARAELDVLAERTEVIIAEGLSTATASAVEASLAATASQLPPGTAGFGITLERPATVALDAIVLRATEQIHSTRWPIPRDVERQMKKQLIRGVAVGDNPRATARRIVKQAEGRFNGGLARATNIARTETLDAHRAAAGAAAKQNQEVLAGWVWSAQLDARTCGSCLANHGSLHPVEEFGPDDHQQGRCARVDKTKTWRELGFDIDEPADVTPDARAWFDNLTEDTQRQILGPQKLQLLKDGTIGWDDLTRKVSTPGWRDAMHNVPVKDLIR